MRRKDKKKKNGFPFLGVVEVATTSVEYEYTKMMEGVTTSIRDAQEWDIPLDDVFIAELVAQHGASHKVDITQAVKRFKEDAERPWLARECRDSWEHNSCGSNNSCD